MIRKELAFCLALAAPPLAAQAFEGTVTMNVTSDNGRTNSISYMLKGGKMRFDPSGPNGSPVSVILDPVGQRMMVIMNAQKMYMEREFPNVGAMQQQAGVKNPTYGIVNHPVILDLYERHGKELNFVGVVIAPEPPSLTDKNRTAMMSASLLKDVLCAEGVIISKEGGGHTDVDIMKNCEECEKLGIKTVLIDNEWLGPDGMNELPLICISPAANAMVSVGTFEEMIELPAMERVIGGDRMPEVPGNPKERLTISISLVPSAISQLGFTYVTTEEW